MDLKLLEKWAVKPLTRILLLKLGSLKKVEVVKHRALMEGDGNPKEPTDQQVVRLSAMGRLLEAKVHKHGFRRKKKEE